MMRGAALREGLLRLPQDLLAAFEAHLGSSVLRLEDGEKRMDFVRQRQLRPALEVTVFRYLRPRRARRFAVRARRRGDAVRLRPSCCRGCDGAVTGDSLSGPPSGVELNPDIVPVEETALRLVAGHARRGENLVLRGTLEVR